MASPSRLSAFYLQLGRLLEAGLPLPEALRQIPAPGAAAPAEILAAILRESPSAPGRPAPLPLLDRELLWAGLQSGQLPETCSRLAAFHSQIADTRRILFGQLLYPALLIHFAAFAFPVLGAISSGEAGLAFDPGLYLRLVGQSLGLIWGAAALLYILFDSPHPGIQGLMLHVPFLGPWRRFQALGHFVYALAAHLDAGAPMAEAWASAARAASLAGLREQARQASQSFLLGEHPEEVIPRLSFFPADFQAYYRTGASSGSLVETLYRLEENYRDQARHQMKVLGTILPFVALLFAAGLIGSRVFSFFSAYFQTFNDVLQDL